MRYVVSFSGGIGSFLAAARCIAKYGKDNTELVFCDTKIEDADLYRFLDDSERVLGVEIARIADGRTPWDVFRDVKYIGNSRTAPCSKILKRDMFERYLIDSGYLEHGYNPIATIVLGVDWTEKHRFVRAARNWEPWPVVAPMCDAPFLDKVSARKEVESFGIRVPRLYDAGFAHNNCGGFCVRAGQGQFKNLLAMDRGLYIMHEVEERITMEMNPKARPFLRKTTNGEVSYLTMREFRVMVESGFDVDKYDLGGCGCFVDDEK